MIAVREILLSLLICFTSASVYLTSETDVADTRSAMGAD
jgi:hypothetical protein